MTLATERQRMSSMHAYIVEIDLDLVTSTTAAYDSDGRPCYNTPTTSGGFAPLTVGTRTLRLCSRSCPTWAGLDAIPCIESVSIAEEKLDLGKALGQFGSASLRIMDFEDDDLAEDPYYSSRTTQPLRRPFFQRLLARNPYILNRSVRVWSGYVTTGFDEANGEWSYYYGRSWTRSGSGAVSLDAIGPLQLINLAKAKAPAADSWKLDADILSADTTATLRAGSYDDAEDPTSGTIRIGDELAIYSRAVAALTLTRGTSGTTAEDADADDTLQRCVIYDQERVDDVIYDLLTTYGEVDASLIPVADWTAEADRWLSSYDLSATLSEPEKIIDLVNEICLVCGLAVWWDQINNELRLLALRPPVESSITDISDNDITGPVEIKRDQSKRISRCDVLFNLRSAVAKTDEAASYKTRVVGTPKGDGEYEHGSPALSEIEARWLGEDDEAIALRTSYTQGAQYRDGLIEMTFTVSKRLAAIVIGDVVRLDTIDLTDATGEATIPTLLRITKRVITRAGDTFRLTGVPTIYSPRFTVVMETGVAQYEDATDAERANGWFLSNNNGTMPNGDDGYGLG